MYRAVSHQSGKTLQQFFASIGAARTFSREMIENHSAEKVDIFLIHEVFVETESQKLKKEEKDK